MNRTLVRRRSGSAPLPLSLLVSLLLSLVLLAAACGSDSGEGGIGGVDTVGGDGGPTLPDGSGDTGAGGDDARKPDGVLPDVPQGEDVPVTPDVPVGEDLAGADVPGTDVPGEDTGQEPCDDGDPCTSGDHLEGGVCVGTPYVCDDGKDCTTDACDGVGGCTYTLTAGACLIDGVCVADGASLEGEPCRVCDATAAPEEWTQVEGDCDDGDACTTGDRCEAGECVGDARDCDDQNACTTDSCDETGCVNAPNALECDDGDACTVGDVCVAGDCQPGTTPLVCDDDDPCTTDGCDAATGCTTAPAPNGTTCSDGDACTLGESCQEGVCAGGVADPCDDANSCTLDTCDPIAGCQHALDATNPCCVSGTNPCDDENPCTLDECDPADQSCTNTPLDGSDCEDGSACTVGDVCVGDTCTPGPAPDCDDGNTCTTDTCDALAGCQHETLPPTTGCDDGDDCTTNDQCQAGGLCAGERLGCVECPPEFWNPMDIVTALALGENGQPGSGLDVDDNPATCAPSTNCSGGVDNQFSALLPTLSAAVDVNAELAAAIADGSINLLFEHRDPTFGGDPYALAVYLGDRVTSGCDPTAAVCEYRVEAASLLEDEGCEALVRFAEARIQDGRLIAGGPGSTFGLSLPFLGGIELELTLYNAKLEADATVVGGAVTALDDGVLGGAVREADILAVVQALPDELFPSNFPKSLVLTLLPALLVEDIDTNGDGTKDATSMGLTFSARAATVVGVSP